MVATRSNSGPMAPAFFVCCSHLKSNEVAGRVIGQVHKRIDHVGINSKQHDIRFS